MIPEGKRVRGVPRRAGEVMRPPSPPPAFPVLDWLFHRHNITDVSTGELYLTRWIVFRCRWFRIFLHRIWRTDKDRNLHNHPWRAICFVLRGWYKQLVRYSEPRTFCWGIDRVTVYQSVTTVRWLNALHTDEYHSITHVSQNLWTLCITGRRYREWGFLVDGRHVDWREYLNLSADAELED